MAIRKVKAILLGFVLSSCLCGSLAAEPGATASFGYNHQRTDDSGGYDTFNAVLRITIPDASGVYVTTPTLPQTEQPLENNGPDSWRIRWFFRTLDEMLTGAGGGTYRIRIRNNAQEESVYQFDLDPSQVVLDQFPLFVTQVQPLRNSLIEIPTTFSWSLPQDYSGGVMAVIVRNFDSPIRMLPPLTTSVTLQDFELGWNQIVLTTARIFRDMTGPMTYVGGFEIVWEKSSTAPADWPSDVPQTFLGTEWMGAYFAIEPGQCVFRIPGDLNGDCQVSLEDFAMMAEFWLMDCRGTQVGADCWAFL